MMAETTFDSQELPALSMWNKSKFKICAKFHSHLDWRTQCTGGFLCSKKCEANWAMDMSHLIKDDQVLRIVDTAESKVYSIPKTYSRKIIPWMQNDGTLAGLENIDEGMRSHVFNWTAQSVQFKDGLSGERRLHLTVRKPIELKKWRKITKMIREMDQPGVKKRISIDKMIQWVCSLQSFAYILNDCYIYNEQHQNQYFGSLSARPNMQPSDLIDMERDGEYNMDETLRSMNITL